MRGEKLKAQYLDRFCDQLGYKFVEVCVCLYECVLMCGLWVFCCCAKRDDRGVVADILYYNNQPTTRPTDSLINHTQTGGAHQRPGGRRGLLRLAPRGDGGQPVRFVPVVVCGCG